MVRSMGWLRAVLVFYLSVELLVGAWAAGWPRSFLAWIHRLSVVECGPGLVDGLVGEDVEAEAVAAGCQCGDDPVEEGPSGP